jgi:hypothetical protein
VDGVEGGTDEAGAGQAWRVWGLWYWLHVVGSSVKWRRQALPFESRDFQPDKIWRKVFTKGGADTSHV